MPPNHPATGGELRTVALDSIDVEEGFNPRTQLDRATLERLTKSIALHGVLQPLTVAATGAGRYRLIAGHRRYLAASELGLAELPVIVRQVADDSAGLDLALVENIAREGLDPVEAKAFKRLLDAGLTRRGIAERLSAPQKRVTERCASATTRPSRPARSARCTSPAAATCA
jgi:ParB family chromosome partitioning protein